MWVDTMIEKQSDIFIDWWTEMAEAGNEDYDDYCQDDLSNCGVDFQYQISAYDDDGEVVVLT
jgi:hypothetical protein